MSNASAVFSREEAERFRDPSLKQTCVLPQAPTLEALPVGSSRRCGTRIKQHVVQAGNAVYGPERAPRATQVALTFMGAQPEVDVARLGIYGTSYSGATVVFVAAIADPRKNSRSR